MEVSSAGRAVAVAIVKQWEGLELLPYKSQEDDGITIGYGHRLNAAERSQYANGITEDQAEALLLGDLARAEKAVARARVPLNPNQEGALVSLAFNIGTAAFAKSTALKMVNAERHDQVPAAIRMWNKVTVGGKKVVSRGLKKRRAHEAFVYARPVAPQPQTLLRSKIMNGSVIGGAGSAIGAATLGLQAVNDALEPVRDASAMGTLILPSWMLALILLIGVVATGFAVWGRLRQRKRGLD